MSEPKEKASTVIIEKTETASNPVIEDTATTLLLKTMQDQIAALSKRTEDAEARATAAEESIANKSNEVEEDSEKPNEKAMALLTKEQQDFLNEPVQIFLHKDTGKYKNDKTVCWNGKNFLIQRGKQVAVPRGVKMILEDSDMQSIAALDLSEDLADKFEGKKDKLSY